MTDGRSDKHIAKSRRAALAIVLLGIGCAYLAMAARDSERKHYGMVGMSAIIAMREELLLTEWANGQPLTYEGLAHYDQDLRGRKMQLENCTANSDYAPCKDPVELARLMLDYNILALNQIVPNARWFPLRNIPIEWGECSMVAFRGQGDRPVKVSNSTPNIYTAASEIYYIRPSITCQIPSEAAVDEGFVLVNSSAYDDPIMLDKRIADFLIDPMMREYAKRSGEVDQPTVRAVLERANVLAALSPKHAGQWSAAVASFVSRPAIITASLLDNQMAWYAREQTGVWYNRTELSEARRDANPGQFRGPEIYGVKTPLHYLVRFALLVLLYFCVSFYYHSRRIDRCAPRSMGEPWILLDGEGPIERVATLGICLALLLTPWAVWEAVYAWDFKPNFVFGYQREIGVSYETQLTPWWWLPQGWIIYDYVVSVLLFAAWALIALALHSTLMTASWKYAGLVSRVHRALEAIATRSMMKLRTTFRSRQ